MNQPVKVLNKNLDKLTTLPTSVTTLPTPAAEGDKAILGRGDETTLGRGDVDLRGVLDGLPPHPNMVGLRGVLDDLHGIADINVKTVISTQLDSTRLNSTQLDSTQLDST